MAASAACASMECWRFSSCTWRVAPAVFGAYSGGTAMTAKERVRALLDRLPDDCSLDDVQYRLYVLQAIEQGEADERAGRLIPHDQVVAELRRKWLLGRAE